MIDNTYSNMFCDNHFESYQIIKPNRITGEGRCKCRLWSAYKAGDLKKKMRRKMAKKSKRQNRGKR